MHLKIWNLLDPPETSACAEVAHSSINVPSFIEGNTEASPLKVTCAPSGSASVSSPANRPLVRITSQCNLTRGSAGPGKGGKGLGLKGTAGPSQHDPAGATTVHMGLNSECAGSKGRGQV